MNSLKYKAMYGVLSLNNASNLWNAFPSDLKSEYNVNVFKNKLKTFYFTILRIVFNADDARTFKLVCCKCRRINNVVRCSC